MAADHDVTQWLRQMTDGNPAALDRVVGLLYDELRAMARNRLSSERSGHTLSATAVVNEVYLKLAGHHRISAPDRTRFLAVAATTMRRVLVDYARTRRRQKRGGGEANVPLDQVEHLLSDTEADEVLALDAALTRLAEINPRGAEVVQQRFYAGLSLEETAALLNVSTKTVQRDWIAARAWLRKEVVQELDP
ncbi:MAG: ECF-type sigma factor [Candidatus Krumholzibacteria bacterium]|nr:ECF-type sigma factor [Candidatus Krumholzibacteria bacterium]MDH4336901.1 ECF-type sigma factor [Candidatus Krumholzibacteria bacterium]MDH5269232.1 ECF-type sigma factor [Candidatus Krumholzibacteria bacterium]MDH5627247.1 ECF-type sigma factor [Candidatus Krumholzibacteria bacterium]